MKKKVFISVGIIWGLICIVFVVFLFRYDIKIIFNNIFVADKTKTINLTEKQKLEDFDFFYDTIISSVPMIDEYESLYGFCIKEKKEYYRELIKDTSSDYEFYCVMSAISQEIPSFHTDLVSPDSISTLYCYNAKKIQSNRTVVSHNKYWKDLLSKHNYNEHEYYVFSYVNGKYLFNASESICEDNYQQAELLDIDGVNIDNYVIDKVLIYNLYYDGVHNKPCRTKIVLNDSVGEKTNVTMKLSDGSNVTKTLYYSIFEENKYLQMGLSETKNNDFEIYQNDNYAYVEVYNMDNNYGEELKDELNKIKCNNIILDLRNNYGGNVEYASKYIYPPLFSNDIEESSLWYMPLSIENKTIADDFMNKIVLKFRNAENSPYYSDYKIVCSEAKQKYKGENENNKNVIILTSQKTGSAADRFASDMKKDKLATIIGNNSGGEGLMYSYNASVLPNSKLVFIYMPGGAKNPDGSDNSVCGTKPDEYLCQTEHDYYTYIEMRNENSNIDAFNEKLKYDTILRHCVDNFLNQDK